VHGTAAGWSATLDPAKRGESSERKWAYQSYGLGLEVDAVAVRSGMGLAVLLSLRCAL
jgi:hypothetical protein